ncbi:MAG: ABC transporter ATP-binding protein [Candidatus Aquicultor sp.]|nr:ABC transporter ATP-binding protein [Candidatus Aquicultor sp.]
MLELTDLRVEVSGKEILNGVNLTIDTAQTHILFGPNGAGKTTLLMSIMGFPEYKVTGGQIRFNEEDVTHLPLHERARLGIGMSFQRPPTIKGLKTRQIIELSGHGGADIDEIAGEVNLGYLLDRDVNDGFSGGEIKRSEMAQLIAQQPSFVLLDEPESGVDLENISLLGGAINKLLQKDMKRQRVNSCLIITHTGYILDYVEADVGHILLGGRISCSGNPREMLGHIKESGYEECAICPSC